MTIEEAKERLVKESTAHVVMDSEGFHIEFDRIIEERLMELDPDFMKNMREMYKESGAARWFA